MFAFESYTLFYRNATETNVFVVLKKSLMSSLGPLTVYYVEPLHLENLVKLTRSCISKDASKTTPYSLKCVP